MYYAKSYPTESIKQHTDNLLENLEVLKKTYGKEIEDNIRKNLKISEERFWILLKIICTYHDIGKIYTPFQNKIREIVNEAAEAANILEQSGYSVFKRNLEDSMYNMNNLTTYMLGPSNELYIIFAYGNRNFTSEMDIVLYE